MRDGSVFMKKALSYIPAAAIFLLLAVLAARQLTFFYAVATPVIRSERVVGTVQGFQTGRRIAVHQSSDALRQRSSFSVTYIVALGEEGSVFVRDEALHPIGSPITLVRKTHINGWVEYDVAGR